MQHVYVEQQNLPELVNSIYLDNLKNIVDDENLNETSDLKGTLQSVHIYNDTFDFFTNNYPRLSIIITNGQYIRFKDQVVFNLLKDANIGDGIGITINDASLVASLPNTMVAVGNDNITSFDELIYFSKITTLGNSAFNNCDNLESIDLTNIMTLGNGTFAGCFSLERVNLPNCTTVGYNVFQRCTSLTYASIPNLTTLNWGLFDSCTALKKVIMNSGITELNSNVFSGCENLEDVENLDLESLTYIGSKAFASCNKLFNKTNGVYENTSITSIDNGAFFGNLSLKEARLPNCSTILNVGTWGGLFHKCSNLHTVVLSDNCTILPENSFQETTSLESFDFSHVVEIRNNAFQNSGIKNVVSNTIEKLESSSFTGCNSLITVNLPNCTSIDNSCFENCSNNLTTVNLPSLNDIPRYAFAYDSNVTSITLGQNVTIGEYAFVSCKKLTTLTFGVNKTSLLQQYTFYECESLTSLSGLSNVVSIGNMCFGSCKSLTTTGLDYTKITSLGESAFKNCEALTDRIELTSLIDLTENTVFIGCKSITYVDISNVADVSHYEYGGTFQNCENLETIILGENLTHLHRSMFQNCKKLKNIDISHITSLSGNSTGSSVFENCESLKHITFSNALTKIPAFAFRNCYSLEEVTIPKNIIEIGGWAFHNCKAMTKVTILATAPPTLGNADAFRYANIDYPIYVPAESVNAYKTANVWSLLSTRIFPIQN